MNEPKKNTIKKSIVDSKLKELVEENNGIYAVILSSIDGHAIAKYTTKEFAESRLAAMTSSCLALGEKIAKESDQSGCDFVIVQNENGFIVLKRIGTKLVLTSFADKSTSMGMLLSGTRNVAENLYEHIA